MGYFSHPWLSGQTDPTMVTKNRSLTRVRIISGVVEARDIAELLSSYL